MRAWFSHFLENAMLDFLAGDVVSVLPVHPHRPEVRELRIRAGLNHPSPGIELPFVWEHPRLPTQPSDHVVLLLKGTQVVGLHNHATGEQVNVVKGISPRLVMPMDVMQSFALYVLVMIVLGLVPAIAGGLAWGIVSVLTRQLMHRWVQREVSASLADLR
jgi:hypothetical protein